MSLHLFLAAFCIFFMGMAVGDSAWGWAFAQFVIALMNLHFHLEHQ